MTPDPHAYLALLRKAEAATEAQQWTDALPLWEQVITHNPVNSMFWLQLAVSQVQLGQHQAAIQTFQKVLELGCPFPPPADYEYCFPWRIMYEIASCYARLNDTEQALEWLSRALNQGYRARAAIAEQEQFGFLKGNPRFQELLGLAHHSADTPGDGWRLDLAYLVGEIKRLHYAPFLKTPEAAFDTAVQQFHDAIPHLNDSERLVGIMKLMRLLGDGHSRVSFWLERPEFRSAALTCYWFSEGVFITAAAPAHASLAGAQIISVGEHPLEQVLAALDSIISQDNPMWTRLLGPFFLLQPNLLHGLGLVPNPGFLPLTVRTTAGDVQQVELAAEIAPILISYGFSPPDDWVRALPQEPNAIPLYLRDAGNYWFEYLPENNAVYMQYKRVREEPEAPFGAFCERLFTFLDAHPGAKLIIDLRRNSGGNTFMHRPLLFGLLQRPEVNRRGRLFILIGRNTFSAAMNGSTFLEGTTNALFVGEPTGASPNFIGETIMVTLPYTTLQVSISDLYWQSSWPMDDRHWIAPWLYIPPSFAAYSGGHDPALEAILSYQDA